MKSVCICSTLRQGDPTAPTVFGRREKNRSTCARFLQHSSIFSVFFHNKNSFQREICKFYLIFAWVHLEVVAKKKKVELAHQGWELISRMSNFILQHSLDSLRWDLLYFFKEMFWNRSLGFFGSRLPFLPLSGKMIPQCFNNVEVLGRPIRNS